MCLAPAAHRWKFTRDKFETWPRNGFAKQGKRYIHIRNIILGVLVINADQQLVNDIFSQFALLVGYRKCSPAKKPSEFHPMHKNLSIFEPHCHTAWVSRVDLL